jgi:hypothetical protein
VPAGASPASQRLAAECAHASALSGDEVLTSAESLGAPVWQLNDWQVTDQD